MPDSKAASSVEKDPQTISESAVDSQTERTLDQIDRAPKDFGFIPIPRHLRHDPEKPHHFGWTLNIAFGFATMFTAANLYYCQPILIQLSQSFNVDYSAVSRIPTLVQAGYAIGLLLITPLGDLSKRRPLILLLQLLATALTIGLALTSSLVAFEILSFLVGVVTVVPQILLPLAADLAPPARRATVISIVLSGLLLGILGARVLAGIIAEYSSWRVVYYFAIGVQVVVLAGSWVVLPDYPKKNLDEGMGYGGVLWSMARFGVTEPVPVQGCLINIASSACFSNFWVTLTFLLGGEPYNYSTLVIGLFGLVGIAGVALGPLLGYAVDRLDAWYATLVSIVVGGVFLAVQLGAGGINVAAVVIAAFGYDLARQSLAVSLSTSIFALDPAARSRMNALFILAFFIGQVIGSSVGTLVFVKYGWRAGAALNAGFVGFQIFVLLVRGPHCARYTWFGYEGGAGWRRRKGG
ncbi:MFS superfamily [Ephemerocybe angulata]|uniref:MFS superfamily n=1 Tax=Ephemerocybe angulata TaxID=980116 RepID=A0A8H6HN90_9AGAR|nr:MFS superfamily [Tulosesus angulatus]